MAPDLIYRKAKKAHFFAKAFLLASLTLASLLSPKKGQSCGPENLFPKCADCAEGRPLDPNARLCRTGREAQTVLRRGGMGCSDAGRNPVSRCWLSTGNITYYFIYSTITCPIRFCVYTGGICCFCEGIVDCFCSPPDNNLDTCADVTTLPIDCIAAIPAAIPASFCWTSALLADTLISRSGAPSPPPPGPQDMSMEPPTAATSADPYEEKHPFRIILHPPSGDVTRPTSGAEALEKKGTIPDGNIPLSLHVLAPYDENPDDEGRIHFDWDHLELPDVKWKGSK